MNLNELINMEMENISRQDRDLLAGMECTIGRCGIDNGSGTCGGTPTEK